jgi:hypothetical protein
MIAVGFDSYISEYGGLIHRGLILGGRLYLEVYGILLSNVSYILAESYNSKTIYMLPESTDLSHPFLG